VMYSARAGMVRWTVAPLPLIVELIAWLAIPQFYPTEADRNYLNLTSRA
jgi:hypothetical protein